MLLKKIMERAKAGSYILLLDFNSPSPVPSVRKLMEDVSAVEYNGRHVRVYGGSKGGATNHAAKIIVLNDIELKSFVVGRGFSMFIAKDLRELDKLIYLSCEQEYYVYE